MCVRSKEFALRRCRAPLAAAFLLACALAVLAGRVAVASEPAPALDDAGLESFLRSATIVAAEEIGVGITRPYKLTLEGDGRRMKAAFKYVEVHESGTRRKEGFPTEREFTDDYHYDRAAYLLDRELGMHMVPVTVLRDWDGKRGVAIAWISGAINESERRTQGLEPPRPLDFERQKAIMLVFDALILNTDRNLGNQLITTDDWRLHLIDHSRSFRRARELPERFAAAPLKLPRELLHRLEELDERRLVELLDGALSRSRVKSLMARRDLILRKAAADRSEYGAAYVFQYDAAEPPGD
jgi:hypothetical protein